jgi:hypothetical protein
VSEREAFPRNCPICESEWERYHESWTPETSGRVEMVCFQGHVHSSDMSQEALEFLVEFDQELDEERVLNLFKLEVRTQARYGLTALNDLRQALDALRPSRAQDEQIQTQLMDRIWYSIHGFLSAAGNMSKLLWPSRRAEADAAARRTALRRDLQVEEDSPLASRVLRNHFEHFDERLDAWAKDWAGGSLWIVASDT